MPDRPQYQYIRSEKLRAFLEADNLITHFCNKKLEVSVYGNATILPSSPLKGLLSGGVVSEYGEYIESSALHEEYYDGSYSYSEDVVRYSDKTAIFLGSWINIYGHAITDNIKKLWFLYTEECQQMLANSDNYDFVFIYLSKNNQRADYVNEIIKVLGSDINKIKPLTQITRYKNILIPDNSLFVKDGVRYYTNEYKSLIQRIKNNCHDLQNRPKKIYLTRTNIRDGKDFNEKCIEREFEKRGYEVVSPEKLSFQQQVSLMKGCRHLVTTVGSVSHNALFCEAGTEVILLNKAEYINGYQQFINKMNELSVIYIDAHHSLHRKQCWSGPFFLWKTKELCQYLGVRSYSHFFSPLWYKYILKIYWTNYLRPILLGWMKN